MNSKELALHSIGSKFKLFAILGWNWRPPKSASKPTFWSTSIITSFCQTFDISRDEKQDRDHFSIRVSFFRPPEDLVDPPLLLFMYFVYITKIVHTVLTFLTCNQSFILISTFNTVLTLWCSAGSFLSLHTFSFCTLLDLSYCTRSLMLY